MIDKSVLASIVSALDAGKAIELTRQSGGDTSAAYRLELSRGPVFLKIAKPSDDDLLTAEADGLAALAAADQVRVPVVLGHGAESTLSWIAMEWLDLEPASRASDARLGTALARLHRLPHERFGWYRENRIGRTRQLNIETSDWLAFFRDYRLAYQLQLAKGIDRELDLLGEQLLARLPAIFDGHEPAPSLLHGDLWSGNRGRIAAEPVIFDPAVSCGDREADIAMTSLFGGFGPEFYAAYDAEWPLEKGHEERMELYRLYHILNHLNLFGGAYLGQAVGVVRKFVR